MAAPTPLPHIWLPRAARPSSTRSQTAAAMSGKSTGAGSYDPQSSTECPCLRKKSMSGPFRTNPAWSPPTARRRDSMIPYTISCFPISGCNWFFSFYSPSAIVRSMSPIPQHYDFAKQLLASKEFFDRSTRVLTEADSGFRPREGMMTVAQQVWHAAQTLDWFIEGASRSEGFDLDFDKQAKALAAVTSLP